MRPLLAVLLALASAPAASAATWTVNNFSDAPLATADATGPPGSLRYILTKQAQPGDTIVFASPSVATANFNIRVPQRLTGLIIDGSVSGGRAAIRFSGAANVSAAGLVVVANRVTIKNLVFDDSVLDIGKPNVLAFPSDIKVLDSRFTGARGELDVGESRRAIVQGNVFDGAASSSVEGSLSSILSLIGNRFAGTGPLSVHATGADRIIVRGNTFERGTAKLAVNGGRITDNRFTGGSLDLQTIFDADVPRVVLMDLNQTSNGGGFALRAGGQLNVTANTFTDARQLLLGCTSDAIPRTETHFQGTVVRGSGIVTKCPVGHVEIAGSQVQNTTGPSVLVQRGRTDVTGTRLTSGGAGVVVAKGARATVRGGLISGNAGAGVRIAVGALPTTVSRVPMGGNGGPGIDRGALGLSPAAAPGAPALTYDRKKVKVRGQTCPGCLVELFESEDGDKIGNRGHGEGIRFLGAVRANGVGRFVYPAVGNFKCPESGLVTATSTRTTPGTSEFARDVPCSCVVADDFGLDPKRVPMNGFANYGFEVVFEGGTEVGDATLTDLATDKYPLANALGPSLSWSELIFMPPSTTDHFVAGFKVNVGYNSSTPATGPVQGWRYSIEYKPPAAAKGQCRAYVYFLYLPWP